MLDLEYYASKSAYRRMLYALGAVLVLLNLTTSSVNFLNHLHERSRRPKLIQDYTMTDIDFPSYYPIERSPVQASFEDSVHYVLNSSEAEDEWNTIYRSHHGFLHLPMKPSGKRREFGLTMFHELHCLRMIGDATVSHEVGQHLTHCFHYVRENIICEADDTLEPVLMVDGHWTVDTGIERTCKDWGKAFELADENYKYAYPDEIL